MMSFSSMRSVAALSTVISRSAAQTESSRSQISLFSARPASSAIPLIETNFMALAKLSSANNDKPKTRAEKHQWMTQQNFSHRHGHLNYGPYVLSEAMLKAGQVATVKLEDGSSAYLHKDAAQAWVNMQAAAKNDGLTLKLNTAYRNDAEQKNLFDRFSNEREASISTAPPGYSEHRTGYALDIQGASSDEGRLWLKKNAARFGFVQSFKKDNPQGIKAEPWHFRFEGTQEAFNVFAEAHRLEKLWAKEI